MLRLPLAHDDNTVYNNSITTTPPFLERKHTMAFFIFAQDFARNTAYTVGYQLGRQCGLGYADMTPCPYDNETLAQEWQWGVNSGRCDS
jgi:hypothetical protein